ncbi:MAG: lipopolysaccharide heptosyltransferase II [Thermodesulfovibrionales bacterium]|nr:lipopolysaccharide heptosyltransferase II [Thermodesulfovibrionales bacterium]
MFHKSCKNLLVRGVNWIGDAVMTLPALRVLRKAMPEARISLLVKPWVSPIFEKDPNVDEIIIYGAEYRGIIGKVKLSRMLNKKGFSSAILFQNAFDAAFITFLAGIKERVGYDRDGRGFLLTTAVSVPQDEGKVHQINYYLNLLKQIGVEAEYSEPYIYLSLDERLSARKFLQDMKRPIVGINPGATYGSAKRWFPERFAEVTNWFIKDTNGSVVIFGGRNEVDIAQEIEYLFRRQQSNKTLPPHPPLNKGGQEGGVLNLTGKTSLRELTSLISECDVFVTNDSGPLHIACAVGTPLVAIFGSTDPKLTGPVGYSNVVMSPNLSCSPCFERTCKSNDMRCMYAITSDDVYYGIKKLLPNRPAVFFDRDGTLCRDVGYLNKYDDLQIFTDIDSITLLKERGFKLIGVTNQSGIARGIIEEDFVREVNKIFIERYDFDDFYYCPHHPEEYCSCRKPEPGMLLRARAEQGIDPKRSYVVGDKETDMLLAKAVGAKGILVRTGAAKESVYADFIAKNITEAVDFIIRDSEKG